MYDDGVVLDPDCSDCGPPHALPDEVELAPPGAGLGVMLAGAADRSVLSGPDLLLLTRARVRQIAHLQAQLMADLVAIAGRCRPRISRAAAGLGAAGRTGRPRGGRDRRRADLDRHRGRQPARLRRTARRVAARGARGHARRPPRLAQGQGPRRRRHRPGPAEPPAPSPAGCCPPPAERTTGQLRARLAKLVIQADPDAARRRYRQGLKGRRVEHGREDDGTARLTGRWLPAARAAAANSRIQAIADWIKDGGDTRTVDQIRADILLDLLQGLPVPGPDGQILHHLPGDPDHPGTEDHPDHEINGDHTDDDTDDDNGDGDGRRRRGAARRGRCAPAVEGRRAAADRERERDRPVRRTPTPTSPT